MSNPFVSALSALVSPGNLASALSLVGSTFSNNVSTTLTPMLNQLQMLPPGSAAANQIITNAETIAGLPTTVFPMLEKLRTVSDPLEFQQYIAAIETMVANATQSFATSLSRFAAAGATPA
jgi:hypothetical protein